MREEETLRIRDERRHEARRRKSEYLGGKVPRELFEDVHDLAKQLRVPSSEVMRRGLNFYLYALGYDAGLRQDLEASAQMQRRLTEMEARAEAAERQTAALAKVSAGVKELHAGIQVQRRHNRGVTQFRSVVLQELAEKVDAKQLQIAVRMWEQADTRARIVAAADLEARSPRDAAMVAAPIIRNVAGKAGGIAALQRALAEETGVSP